jgi:hypothetical protein
MEVEEKRTIVATADASEEVKAEVQRAGGTVLQRPTGAPVPQGPSVHATPSPQPLPAPSPSTSPAEGARAGLPARPDRSPRHPEDCKHDRDGYKLLPVVVQSATPLNALYCSGCGSLGPTNARQPTLARWMPPG